MKKFFKEFKAFISKGNVMDMAIGVIIGGAFGKIVSSLVNDMIMPLITAAVGAESFESLKVTIVRDVTLNYGTFIQTVIDFVIIALVIFIFLKIIMSARNAGDNLTKDAKKMLKKMGKAMHIEGKNSEEAAAEAVAAPIEDAAAPAPAVADAVPALEKPSVEELLTEIRDLLAKLNAIAPSEAEQLKD